jgi:DNA-binding IclR family transcriptional regulator
LILVNSFDNVEPILVSENSMSTSTGAKGAAKARAPKPRQSRGIQSIEVGSRLLSALVHLGRPMPLKALAEAAGMTPAKAHPYLVSFGKVGLIEQNGESGHYGLGPLALQMGLIGLHHVDPVRLASAELPRLAREVGQTVGIAVWGNRGPTFVRLEDGPTAIHVNMRHGTVVSVRGTATGRLFSAFVPRERVIEALRAESGRQRVVLDEDFAADMQRIREQRFAMITDGTVPGITALAAPVFDGFGTLVMALTAIGPSATLEASIEGPAARALSACADGLSARLGSRR